MPLSTTSTQDENNTDTSEAEPISSQLIGPSRVPLTENSANNDASEPEYTIEKVVGHEVHRKRRKIEYEFRVRFEGYGEDDLWYMEDELSIYDKVRAYK